MAAVTICSDFRAHKNKVSHCFHFLPIYLPWSDGTRCHDLSFLNVEYFFYFILFFSFTILYWFWHISKWIHHRYTCVPRPEPSSLLPPHTIPLGHPSALSPFTFIKKLFSSSLLSTVRLVSSAYLRILIFLLAILIPAYASPSLAFLIMYSSYKLNKQGDNIQPWCTPFPIWDSSAVTCPVLTVASWPAYRFLKRQVRWSGIPISWRISHSVWWSTQSKALA